MADDQRVHDCCGQAEHLLYTASGPILLSSHGSSPNTTTKTISVLLRRLPQVKLDAVTKVLRSLGLVRLETFAQVLRSFSDIQFDLFVEVIDHAPIPRILKYIEICAIPQTAVAEKVAEPIEISQTPKELVVTSAPQPRNNEVIVRRMRATPLEITHVITDQFLRKLFMPGFLFPDQLPLKNGCFQFQGNFYPDTDPHALLALNKYLLPTYERLLWEENVWVIGPGYDWHTLKFIERIPDTCMRIKRVYLTFTTEDLCGASELMPAMIESVRDANGNLKLSAAELLERFTSHCDDTSRELTTMWWAKFSAMTFLALDDLTLDLRRAYGPDEVFLPCGDWIQTLSSFWYGLPAKFTILAPTAALEAEVRQAFGVVNAPRP